MSAPAAPVPADPTEGRTPRGGTLSRGQAGRQASSAPFERRLLEVAANEELGAYRLLRVLDPNGPAFAPGQFAMLAAERRWGGGEGERPFLARAFSVARQRGEELQFLLEDVGPGTRRLCELSAGERVWAVGPLGRGFRAPTDERRALLVGGGVGIAPLAILQDSLPAPARALLGFRDAARARGAELLGETRLASDDGSVGHHGRVTELLDQDLDEDGHALVYACGPAAMLEGVREICARRGVPAQLALEAPMACGFGACYGCVVRARGGRFLRVCVDGPVLDAEQLERVDEHAGAPA